MDIVTANDIWEDLIKLIDMPKHCTAFVIKATGPADPVIVEATCYVEMGTGEKVTKRYTLIEEQPCSN